MFARTGPVHSARLGLTVASLTSASVEMHSSCIRPIEISARTLGPTTDVRRALKRIYTSSTAVVDVTPIYYVYVLVLASLLVNVQ